jgi:hypothetical protein
MSLDGPFLPALRLLRLGTGQSSSKEGAALAAHSSPVAAGPEARKGKRSRVLFKAIIRSLGQQGEARIRDLSKLGALLEMDRPPAAGSDVIFLRGTISAAARIAWVDGARAGLEFDCPVDEKEMLAQPAAVPPKAPARRIEPDDASYRRPGVLSTQMTDEERRLARVWAAQMGLSFEE